jgi:tetratricopeptide (TPR) repeat protein
MPNWEDATLELPPGEIPPDRTVTVKLQRPGTLQLLVESRPAGADVFIDGEFRGKTPMELSGIEPRQTEILFQMKDREQVTKTVDLQNAKGHLRIRAELPSLTAEYYEQKIREEPRLIHHYADLAHHYMLEGRLKDAMNTFQKGVEVVFQNPGIPDASRLWSEIQRVTDKQYDYGDADTVRQARALLRDCLAALYKEYPKNREVMFYANLVYVLDELNERQRAQEVFETAWKLFPGDRVLRRLRQKGFAPP